MRIRSRIWAWKMRRRRRRIVGSMHPDISSYIRQFDNRPSVKGLDAWEALQGVRRGSNPEDPYPTKGTERS